MKNIEIKKKVKEFLDNMSVGVLSTVNSDSIPYATTIYFTADDDLSIYFLSKAQTRKIENIQNNNNVMLVSFDTSSQSNLQVSGQAIELEDGPDSKEIFGKIIEATRKVSQIDIPPVSKLFAGQYVIYEIKPQLINYSVYNNKDLEMAVFETLEF